MSEHHWLLHHNKAHCCQPIPGEAQYLTRCGKRVHPLFLSQPKDEDARCKICQMILESRE